MATGLSLSPRYLRNAWPRSRVSAVAVVVLLVGLVLRSIPLPASDALILGLRKRNGGGSGGSQWAGGSGGGIGTNRTGCNPFVGSWVREDGYPLYQASRCSAVIDPQFNCQLFGRPDTEYQRFRWRPNGCELPRFDGLEFLVRMRGKTVLFVGDSLGRNQWESLICMLSAAAPPGSPTQLSRGDPLSEFRFPEYGLSLQFYRAPYLVDIAVEQGGKRVLRLDEVSGNAAAWRNADVLSFNSGHWWAHRGALQGWNYMRDAGGLYADMDRLVAFQKGLTTWANWVDANVDTSRTRVFFQAISPTHYNPLEWNDPVSKNCYGERVPVSGWSSTPGAYADQNEQMRVVRAVLGAMRKPPYLLDITALSELRKDGHPSIYSGDLNPEQRANPDRSADCSHWCLPGLPDTWNQLFYTAIFFPSS